MTFSADDLRRLADCMDNPALMTPEDSAAIAIIAAGPDLLAALKSFVEPWSKGGQWEHKINYDTFNNARMTIAKAKGGAS